MAWTTFYDLNIVQSTVWNDKTYYRTLKYKIPDPNVWRQCINKVVTKIGDIVTANSRRSWVGMKYYDPPNIRGLQIHEYIKDILLFGKIRKNMVTTWSNGRRYKL